MTDEFLAHRRMLLGLAYRLVGTLYDAEDVLQEAYLRWTRADRSEVLEPRRYLTRVVARLAVDALRARQARREEYVGTWLPEPIRTGAPGAGPSAARLAGAALGGAGFDVSGYATAGHSGRGTSKGASGGAVSGPVSAALSGGGVVQGLEDLIDTSDLSLAVLHLMERLTPPQRAVYVLRTAFELPYAEIAAILDRAEDDCRQLHRRAGAALAGRARFSTDPAEHARLLEGFVAAAREGDVERLEQLLHEDVIAWNDGGGKVRTGPNPIRGRAKVMRFFVATMRRRNQQARADETGTQTVSLAGPAGPAGPAGFAGLAPERPFTAVPTGVNGQYALLVDANYRYTMCVTVVDGRIQDLFRVGNPAKLSTFGGPGS